ncbi:MAG: hypothetical protein HC806_00555 [Anaerolineae bacterium]|nr:hypothetical protein [Anaerolineae bacterium]
MSELTRLVSHQADNKFYLIADPGKMPPGEEISLDFLSLDMWCLHL